MHSLEHRYIRDGIYAVPSEIVVEQFQGPEEKHELTADTPGIAEFAAKYPDYRIASAYETYTVLLLSGEPVRLKGNVTGNGFNYGSTNLIEDCPSRLLILAQND
jgi:hypothetical protein